jgi:hypothetical protein
VRTARERSGRVALEARVRHDWVLDLDIIEGFFDSIDWELTSISDQ